MTVDNSRDLALRALAALEMDQLDQVNELAQEITGTMKTNGIRDFLVGSVLARRGEHEKALQIAMELYGQDESRPSGERLRADTLALMQGLRGRRDDPLAVPVEIDPLEPLNHPQPGSPLGPDSDWLELFGFWCERIGQGNTAELGRLGQSQLGRLIGASGDQVNGLRAAQLSMGYDQANAFAFVYYLLALRGVEALPSPKGLITPESDEQVHVSIILPVYNKWILTLNCLRSIVAARHGTENFEVILADDASTDETHDLAARNSWLKHARMERNSGFVDNCNHAAEMARGQVLVFLNNDTLVGDNWLGELLDSLRRRPGAGVVGSQIYASDGGLLESGGILWGNGDVWNHGRGFGAERWFELDHEREVDYVSGCALAIRHELWKQLGGFDTRYRPAYCEDADLCMRVREASFGVLVQPQSRILHLEGLSNAKDTESGLKRYQTINLEQLRNRWSRILLTEQPIDMSRQLLASDRGLRRGPVAIVVDHYFPTPDRDAGSRCTLALVSSLLALGFKIVFLPENFASMESYRRRLERWGVLCMWGDEISRNWPDWLSKQVERVDLILYNRPHITCRFEPTLTRLYPGAYKVYNTHDLHGWRERLEARQPAQQPERLAPPLEPTGGLDELCTAQERQILSRMNAVISISSKESDLLKRHLPRGVYTVPGYISRWRGSGNGRTKASTTLLFVGGFGHKPNRLGLEWFLQWVWPKLAKEAELVVVGSNCPSALEQQLRTTAGVHFEGSVSDGRLAELYANTRLSLAPLPYGAGLKGKVVEALSWGHRVIGSAYAFEGLEDEPWAAPALARRHCSTALEFETAIRESLAMDSLESEELEKQCKTYIERCFSSEAHQQALRNILPAELLTRIDTKRLATEEMGWPDPLKGAQLNGLTLLATSRGLSQDGWLEQVNHLVIRTNRSIAAIELGLYLPATGTITGPTEIDVVIGDGSLERPLRQERFNLQRGLTRTSLQLPSDLKVITMTVRSFYSYRPDSSGDQRQLVAVLSEFKPI